MDFVKQFVPNTSHVHKITEVSTVAHITFKRPAFSVSKISYRTKLNLDWTPFIKPFLNGSKRLLSCFLLVKFYINVSSQMVRKICAHTHLLNIPKFYHLFINVFIKIIKMVSFIAICESRRIGGLGKCCLNNSFGRNIHVLHAKCLREEWSIVKSGASITVSTRTNFEIKRAIYFVLFSSKHQRKMLSHFERGQSVSAAVTRKEKHQRNLLFDLINRLWERLNFSTLKMAKVDVYC
mmetsp:Transcript_4059/g.7113  ORF Transcript_4059/g.7113 Transcript_4059/m.7113 type:complete len:236 (-) Transcript_4059:172-879(-)